MSDTAGRNHAAPGIKDDLDRIGQEIIEGRQERPDRGGAAETTDPLSAGPHAEPGLMNDMATPGSGALAPTGRHDDMDSSG